MTTAKNRIAAATAVCVAVIAGALATTSALGQTRAAPGKLRVLFNRFQLPEMTVAIADGDGGNERVLLANEGRVYSPAFSADGQWVVVTIERGGQADIYRAHPDGTGLEQLTNATAFDDQGALSPDGRLLAFVSSRDGGMANIWIKDLATGELRNLTRTRAGNFRPAWSPDGEWLAFSSDRDAAPGDIANHWEHLQSTGIYVIRPNGRGLRRITRAGGVAGSPEWSADGRRVLYYETDEAGAYLAKFGGSRVEIVSTDVATGERVQHTASREIKLSPSWLADGRMSYVSRSSDESAGLRVWHPASRTARTLVAGNVRNPSWATDRNTVAFERIQAYGATQRMEPTFSRDPDFELFLSDPFPSFSPDGTRLLFTEWGRGVGASGVEQSMSGNTSIVVMDAHGRHPRTVFHREGFSAFSGVWSPRGDEIALSIGRYFRAPGAPAGQIALVKPDGSDLRIIVDDEINNGFPSWSPDGTRLVFKRGKDLVVMTVADRKVTPLVADAHYNNFPQWSPRGDEIMFTSDRDGNFELYTIRPDGTGLRRLTNEPTGDAHSVWCRGGDWIVFTSGRHGFKDEMALFDGVPQPYGEIYAMRADGTDVRQLTDNKWEDASATCAPGL